MIELSRRPSFAAFISTVQEPQIALAALTRLRWLAVIGQLTATIVSVALLHLHLPLIPIATVILLTAFSNTLLTFAHKRANPSPGIIKATLLLDVLLLTALLFLTGGARNPFASLYLIHVAMAVIVLPAPWTWAVVTTVGACYGLLFAWHLPLDLHLLPPWVSPVGSWISLTLVSVLTVAFIGRVTRALRQREHELAAVRDRAAKNEQLAALTTLAAGAAHELNTPLGTIAVVAKELELSSDPADAVEDARLIRREVDRCRAILSRLRLNIDEEVSHRTLVRIDDLIAGLRASLAEPELQRFSVHRAPGTDVVYASPRALEQSLLVLVRNAFDASDPARAVMLSIHHRSHTTTFEVRDQGVGMSDDLLRRIGEPFFTTKEPGKGMGLGIFLVRLFADQCGATFTIDSHPGRGTTCVLELPDVVLNNAPIGDVPEGLPAAAAATVDARRSSHGPSIPPPQDLPARR